MKKVYQVVEQNYNELDGLALNVKYETTNKEEALEEFNKLCQELQGWIEHDSYIEGCKIMLWKAEINTKDDSYQSVVCIKEKVLKEW